MKYDMMDWFLPIRNLVGAHLQEGLLPLWNPYTNLGYPLIIDPQSGALYPITWLLGYCFGYGSITINTEYLLHILLAFWGMKKLGEVLGASINTALLLGFSYACCGFFVGNAQHLSWIISAAWLPFVLMYYLRLCKEAKWRNALGLSLVFFLMLTGGYPAFFIVCLYLLIFLFLFKMGQWLRQKRWDQIIRFLSCHLIAVISFALQSFTFLLFFLEAMPLLLRSNGLSLAEVQFLPFSPTSWFSFVFPLLSAGSVPFLETDISMANGYLGILVLLSLLWLLFEKWTWKKMGFFTIGLFFLGVALGEHFVLRAWLYNWVPMMGVFKYPALFRLFGLLFLLLLWADGFDQLLKQKPVLFSKWQKLLPLGLLIAGGSGLWLYGSSQSTWAWPADLQVKTLTAFIQANDPFRAILLQWPVQMGLLLLTWLIFRYAPLKGRLPCLALLMALDLFLATQFNICSTVISDARTQTFAAQTASLANDFPIPQLPLIQVPHEGDGSFYPMWYNNNILKRQIAKNGYNNLKLQSYHLFNEHPLRDRILDNQLIFLSEAFTQLDTMSYPSPPASSKVELLQFQPHRMIAEVRSQDSVQINLLQADYPGWQVSVDERPLNHFRVLDFFMAIRIPAGTHQVTFEFVPKKFRISLLISALSFIFILLVLLLPKKQNSIDAAPQND
ncbi:MAG: YfhO family protein [Bacteroidota bacterium]